MSGTSNIIFMVFAGLGSLLTAIPFPKALASGNVGTSMVIVWTELACLIQFVNAIHWHRNLENSAPAWCDFSGYFLIATDIALAACGVSINRHLYMIVTLDPRRHQIFNAVVDVVLCLVIPWLSTILLYIVQQYRFYIFEDVGCLPGVGTVTLAFPLVWMLPLLAGVVSAIYACLAIRANLQRNHGLMGEAGLNSAWSRRLMVIGAITSIYGLIPTSIAIALMAVAFPVAPWPGLRAIHSTINVIVYVPALEWHSSSTRIVNVELRRWTIVTLGFVIFVLLGLTADVKKMYCAPFKTVKIVVNSIGQAGSSRTVLDLERNEVSGIPNDRKASRYSRFRRNCLLPFWRPGAESQRERFVLTNRPRPDSELEDLRLAFPISRPHDDAIHPHPASTSCKPCYEKDGPCLYMTR